MGDDHAVSIRRDRGSDPVPVGGRELRAVHRHQVDDLDVEPGGQVGSAAGGSLHAVVAAACGDGAAGGDDDEATHG